MERSHESFKRVQFVAPAGQIPAASSNPLHENWRYQQLRLLAPIIEHLIPEFICELELLQDASDRINLGLSQRLFWSLIEESQRKRRDSSLASEMASRALELIRQRVFEQFLIADIASELGVHRSQLSRWFKASYGITLSNCIRIFRIEKSIELLNQNEMAISSIALACGFNDQSHFTRQFRETMKTTPAKWRWQRSR